MFHVVPFSPRRDHPSPAMYACPRHSTPAIGGAGYRANSLPVLRFLEGRWRRKWRLHKSRHRGSLSSGLVGWWVGGLAVLFSRECARMNIASITKITFILFGSPFKQE